MPLTLRNPGSQEAVLRELAALARRSVTDPGIKGAAHTLIQDCGARDDQCELEAIFNAVKNGDPRVPALRNGVRYVSDPRVADYFAAPKRLLQQCEAGGCGGDCDDAAAMVAALCGSVGFKVGLRAWGEKRAAEFSHVYAVAAYPKHGGRNVRAVGLDTTVPESHVGWEPPNGRVLTAWVMD